MNPNTPPLQAATPDVIQPPLEPPKKRNILGRLIILLIILVLLAAGDFTYFYAMTYSKINSQLDEITHTNSAPRPSPTVVTTTAWKTYINAATNWKTCLNTANSFSIDYPADSQIERQTNDGIYFLVGKPIEQHQTGLIDALAMSISISNDGDYLPTMKALRTNFEEQKITTQTREKKISPTITAHQLIVLGGHDGVSKNVYTFIQLPNHKLVQITSAIAYKNQNTYEQLSDKIISTFKLTDKISPTCIPRPACLDATPRCLIPESENMCPPSATPTQKTCTLEAKICPDGSSVSRTGTNCEFAPCPTK